MEEIDLREDSLYIFNQKEIQSCACISSLNLLHYILEKHLNVTDKFSYMFTYHASRKLEGNEKINCGVSIKTVLKSINHYGVLPMNLWKYGESKTTSEILNLATKTIKIKQLEAKYIEFYKRKTIVETLKNGYPFVFGIQIDQGFLSAKTNGGIVPMPSRDIGFSFSGHAMLGLGLTNINQKWYIIAQNSRGSNWGDKGYCYLPIDYFVNPNWTSECWTFNKTNQ